MLMFLNIISYHGVSFRKSVSNIRKVSHHFLAKKN